MTRENQKIQKMIIKNIEQARNSINNSFKQIQIECKSVLGSELHYQAIIYHCLRNFGNIPISQIGMNVKIAIKNPKTHFFKEGILKKNKNFREGKEIIPDISIFSEHIKSDFRRRNFKNTLKETLYSLEIKASERENGRLQPKEIKTDIIKLKSQYTETKLKHNKEIGIGIMVIDTAPNENERMRKNTFDEIKRFAKENGVDFWYCS